jgi:hypothetical protein
MTNAFKHYRVAGADELAPRRALFAPRTFMLRMQQ